MAPDPVVGDLAASPKRRHILSSFNPERPVEPPRPGSMDEARRGSRDEARRDSRDETRRGREPPGQPEAPPPPEGRPAEDENTDPLRPRSSRLHLKDPRRRRRRRSPSRSSSPVRDEEAGDRSSRRTDHGRHCHRDHRHRHRRHRSPMPGPPPLDPDTAFRESLFDAMADDEAAAYWEGVYGQPIHVYSNQKVGPQGELERMTDDEYAAFVRQKMWEKTHQGLLEEKARREKQRQDKMRRELEEDYISILHEMQQTYEGRLRRAKEEKRRELKEWDEVWSDYVDAWAAWKGDVAKLPWPVRGGTRPQDVSEGQVRAFFILGLDPEQLGQQAFAARLKEERVRWHPDKIQQRLGGLGGAGSRELMRDVTAVFQIIDRLWGEARAQAIRAHEFDRA